MKNYRGIIIAVENYHDSKKMGKVKHAIDDADSFLNSLIELGCDSENFEYLPDNLATKTTIEKKVREISNYATEGDIIIFYYAGHGFYYNGKNLISSIDTYLDNLEETAIELNSILASFENSNSKKTIAFLDCCHSGIKFSVIDRSPVTDFSSDELKYEYSNVEHLTVFASCKSEEKSQVDIERKHGVWSYYLIQALQGKAKNIYDGNLLFSDKLQKYLFDKTFHRVKKITTEKKNQSPIKFGKESLDRFIVADLTEVFQKKEITKNSESISFESAILLTTDEDWVRNLPGFDKNKNHKPPKSIDDYHKSWIKKISTDLIKDELNDIAKQLKAELKYKRKDIEDILIEDGIGQLVTVDFDYIIEITQSQEEADTYVIKRSIENFRNSDILNNEDFNKIFEKHFDELEFSLSRKINVDKIIDMIEEIDNEELIRVEYDNSDTSFCTILTAGYSGHIELSERNFKIINKNKVAPIELILSCQQVYKLIGSQGLPKMLN
ncbi:caspase family protein [Gelidibacter japonicus]|uniref:caspase family protein n=1 Tax=Gelidibacter japonicus TaxID=1962232 RepID=UPI003A94E594